MKKSTEEQWERVKAYEHNVSNILEPDRARCRHPKLEVTQSDLDDYNKSHKIRQS